MCYVIVTSLLRHVMPHVHARVNVYNFYDSSERRSDVVAENLLYFARNLLLLYNY